MTRLAILLAAIMSLVLLMTATEARAQCPGGTCQVSAHASVGHAPVRRTVRAAAVVVRGPARFVRFRAAPRMRAVGRRVGYRIVRPFGGRFRR